MSNGKRLRAAGKKLASRQRPDGKRSLLLKRRMTGRLLQLLSKPKTRPRSSPQSLHCHMILGCHVSWYDQVHVEYAQNILLCAIDFETWPCLTVSLINQYSLTVIFLGAFLHCVQLLQQHPPNFIVFSLQLHSYALGSNRTTPEIAHSIFLFGNSKFGVGSPVLTRASHLSCRCSMPNLSACCSKNI